ncbi:uncharacterized protein NDAI_0F00340, partial [Naumovozyma dairenensis CBS 421]
TLSSSVTGGGCIAFLGGIASFSLDSTKEIDQTFWVQSGVEFHIIRGSYTNPLIFRGFGEGSSIFYAVSDQTKIQNWNYDSATGSMIINTSSSGASSDIINIDLGPGYNASLFTVRFSTTGISNSNVWQVSIAVKYNGESPETTPPSECRLPSSMDYGQCSVLHLSSSSSLPPPSSSLSSSSSSSSIKATQVSSSLKSTQASLNERETSSRCSSTNTKTEFETTIYTTHREYVTGTHSLPITLSSTVVTYFVTVNQMETMSIS